MIMSFLVLNLIHAQTNDSFKKQLSKSVENIQSLSGDFKQEKSLSFLTEPITSLGNFFYDDSDYLKWEYISPYQYSIELKEGILKTTDGKNVNEINVNSSKTFKTINDIFLQSIKGDIFNSEDIFFIKVKETTSTFEVQLTPREDKLKEMVSEMNLTFDKTSMLVKSVVMKEQSGDQTTIEFSKQKVNE